MRATPSSPLFSRSPSVGGSPRWCACGAELPLGYSKCGACLELDSEEEKENELQNEPPLKKRRSKALTYEDFQLD